MREFRSQLTRHLQRRSCPAAAVTRLLEETDAHRADLQAEGLRNGLGPAEALQFAEQRLGSAEAIAEQFIRMRQRRDWWGRHPFLLFGLLPVILYIFSFAGASLWVGSFGTLHGWWKDPSSLNSDTWMGLTMMVPLFHFVLVLLIPALACRLASYYCYGWKWALLACLIFAFHGYFHFFVAEFPLPGMLGRVTWGYALTNDLSNHLWKGLPPLLLFGFHCLRAHYLPQAVPHPNLNPLHS